MTRYVGHQPIRIHGDAIDLGGTHGVAVVAVLDRERGQRRTDDEVVAAEHVLERVEHLSAHRLVVGDVECGQRVAALEPFAVLRRKVVGMVAQQVDPCRLEPLDPGDVDRHDQPAPEIRQLPLVAPDPELDLLDVRACVLEHPNGVRNDSRDAPVDGEDVVVRGVRDPHVLDRAPNGTRELGGIVDRQGIARVIAGDGGQDERRVLDRARERSFEQERVGPAEGVGCEMYGTRPKDCL